MRKMYLASDSNVMRNIHPLMQGKPQVSVTNYSIIIHMVWWRLLPDLGLFHLSCDGCYRQ